MQHGELRSYRSSRLVNEFVLVLIIQLQRHLRDRRGIVLHLPQARLLHQRQHQVIMRLEKESTELKVIPLQCLCQLMLMIERGNPLSAYSSRASSEIPEWLQEIREILVDEMKFLNAETQTPVLLMKYL